MSCNELTAAEIERLGWLGEELGEVQQIIGKIFRHGYNSWWPPGPESSTNRELLEKEIADVLRVLNLMALSNDIDQNNVNRMYGEKIENYKKCYLHHQDI